MPIPGTEDDLWCNEEGKLRGLPPNPLATALVNLLPGDFIVGAALILGVDDEGESISYNPVIGQALGLAGAL